MAYELIIKPSAERALDRIPRPDRRRLLDALQALRENPRPVGAIKLAGQERMYRLRVGAFRAVYEIEDDKLLVLVLRVAHRSDAYRGM